MPEHTPLDRAQCAPPQLVLELACCSARVREDGCAVAVLVAIDQLNSRVQIRSLTGLDGNVQMRRSSAAHTLMRPPVPVQHMPHKQLPAAHSHLLTSRHTSTGPNISSVYARMSGVIPPSSVGPRKLPRGYLGTDTPRPSSHSCAPSVTPFCTGGAQKGKGWSDGAAARRINRRTLWQGTRAVLEPPKRTYFVQ